MSIFQRMINKDIKDQQNQEVFQVLTEYDTFQSKTLTTICNIKIHVNHYFSKIALEVFSSSLLQFCEALKSQSEILLEKLNYIKQNKKTFKKYKTDKPLFKYDVIIEDSQHMISHIKEIYELILKIPNYNSTIVECKQIIVEVHNNFTQSKVEATKNPQ